jgi:hypothetical protein
MFKSCWLTLLLTCGIPTRYMVLLVELLWPLNLVELEDLKDLLMSQVYSLIGGFCGSPVSFHAKDGSGYKFLGEAVLQLDKINPQVCFILLNE